MSRRLVGEWLTAWSFNDLIHVTATVTTAFVEDASAALPQRREDPQLGAGRGVRAGDRLRTVQELG